MLLEKEKDYVQSQTHTGKKYLVVQKHIKYTVSAKQ